MSQFSAKRIYTYLIVIVLLSVPAMTSDQIPGADQDHPILLSGGTIFTVSGGVIKNGMILFDQGKIVAIGATVSAPPGTETIDISGKSVYPGFINANSAMGLVEISSVRATVDAAESGDVTPEVRAEVAINPDSELIPVTRANGVVATLTVPGGGLISGSSALITLDGWTWEDMTLAAPVGMHLRWPSMTVSRSPWVRRSPEEQVKEREKNLLMIKDAFTAARAYAAARRSGDAPTDSRWEALIPVVEGKLPVFVHASEIRQIQSVLNWAEDEGLHMVLVGGHDAWRVSERLNSMNVPVIITSIHGVPAHRWEDYDSNFTLASRLSAAGVKFCIARGGSTFGSAHDRNLPFEAGTAVAHGLSRDEGIKAITLYPAEILGVAGRLGSLEAGKDATLIVVEGDPLEIRSQVTHLFIEGRRIDLSSKHTQLYEKYRTKYGRLPATGE